MGVGRGEEVHFEMSPKAIMILFNKNVPRTKYKPGTILKTRDRAGDKKTIPSSYEAYNLGWRGGRENRQTSK